MKKITLIITFLLISLLTKAQTLVGVEMVGSSRQHLGYGCSINNDGTYFAGGFPSDDNNIIEGTTRIYSSNGTTNTLQQSIVGDADSDFFGFSSSMNSVGDRIIIGAYKKNNGATADVGQIKVYQRSGSTWSILGLPILGDAANDVFGYAVAMSSDGAVIAVGSPNADANGTDSGKVEIFVWNTSTSAWTQRGSAINGEAAGDQFGISVALSQNGNFLIIGGRNNDGTASNAGHVRVYAFNGSSYAQRGTDINGATTDDLFGSSVSISDNGANIVVGAPRKSNGVNVDAGAVYCYSWNNTAYVQRGQTIVSPTAGNNYFGSSVSMSANGINIAVGAPNYTEIFSSQLQYTRGFANCFKFNTTTSQWNQFGTTVLGNESTDVSLGTSVVISKNGNFALFGAPNQIFRGYMELYDFTNATTLSNSDLQSFDFKIFPNPSKNYFTIESKNNIEKLSIYNLIGQKVKEFNKTKKYFIEDLKSGTYIIEAVTEKGIQKSKIVKN